MTLVAAASELARALGAVVLTPPPASAAVSAALGLPPLDNADYTDAFVLGLPPHAAIYLGPEGKLGGEGLDRVAGFWRALALDPPGDADHLGTLLLLYAELTEAAPSTDAARARLEHARAALFDEHIWSWAPRYLDALTRTAAPSVGAWAVLARTFLDGERAAHRPPAGLPLALREAPSASGDLLDDLLAPIRSGLVISQADLAACARAAGVGFRRGERRFALRAMVNQDADAVLAALGELARAQSAPSPDPVLSWWAERAAATADRLAAQ